MDVEILPLLSFVLITTFTPGPNNMSSASMGVNLGYRKTLIYLLGIACGFILVMLICAYLAALLLAVMPRAQRYLRWIGAAYILWLAIRILRANWAGAQPEAPSMSFARGFILQLVNPKVAVYGLTLYSTFLAPVSGRLGLLSLSALIFAATAFASISTWALFGAAIGSLLRREPVRKAVNIGLCLLLVYAAIDLSGILVLAGSG